MQLTATFAEHENRQLQYVTH